MKELLKEVFRENPIGVIWVVLLVFLYLLDSASFAFEKSKYTEMTGVIVDKYTKSKYVGGRHPYRRVSHLCVRYIDNQEEKIAEGLKANFWETEGSTVRFYITPDGRAVRNTVINEEGLYIIVSTVIVFIVITFKKMNGKFNVKKAMPVGTVIDDYDFILDEENPPTNNTFQKSSANETVPDKETEPSPLKMSSSKPSFELYTEEEYKNRK